MTRAELTPPRAAKVLVGEAEPLIEDRHNTHAFLYIPDLSSQTGWSGHRVPERRERQERRSVGFRR